MSATDHPALGAEEALLFDLWRRDAAPDETLLHVAGHGAALAMRAVEAGAGQVILQSANRAVCAAATADNRCEVIESPFDGSQPRPLSAATVICSLGDCAASDPLLWIDRLMQVAQRRVIVSIETPAAQDFGFVLTPLLSRLPLMWLPRPAKPGRLLRRAALLTPAAIRHAFKYRSSAFEPVKLTNSPIRGRIIAEARRRSIGELVVVAGPSSSGKSTFATRLATDEAFRRQFGLAGEWRYVRGRDVVDLEAGPIPKLIVELDLMAVETGDIGAFGAIPQFHILHCAASLRLFTLLPRPQADKPPMSPAEQARAAVKCGRLGEALAAFYRRQGGGGAIRALYESWFDWSGRLAPRETRLVLNDYSAFREITRAELDRELPPSDA